MRVGVVINPVSGRLGHRPGTGAARLERARRLLADTRTAGEAALTTARGHGAELARSYLARGCEVVIAWGGDGTVHEVAGVVRGSPAALGIVPSGSGDGVARTLGLPVDPDRAFRAAVGGFARPMDVGFLGDRHFLNIAGIGFDAAVGLAFDRRRTRGALGYLASCFSIVWSYRPSRCEVAFEGHASAEPRFLVAFANGREYGNGLVLSADADPADGWLDAVVVDDGPPWRQIWRARRLAFRRRRPAEGILRARVRTARVAGEGLACHVDGEPFDLSGPADVRVEAGALRIAGWR